MSFLAARMKKIEDFTGNFKNSRRTWEVKDFESSINTVYRDYLPADQRYQLFFGGSSSGKSYFLAQRTVIDVLNGHNYLVVRNVKGTIRTSTFNEIRKAITNFNLNSFFSVNKSEMTITCLHNNKQILFLGLDDPEKIKSTTPINGVISVIWCEESTEMEYNAFKQLDKRLRGLSAFRKRLIMSFNPILQSHWIYENFFKNWEDNKTVYKDSDLLILKTTYKDNAYLEEDDIKNLENETDPYFYKVYTLGSWGTLGSVIFRNWTVEDCSEIRKIADNYHNGLDFGFAKDPAVLIQTYYDKKRKIIYILDEFYRTGLTNDLLAKEIISRIGNQYVTCDSAEPKSIFELRLHNVSCLSAKKGKDSINHGIQWLQQQKIIIDPKCQNFKNEIQQYKYQEDKNGNVIPKPVDRNNDGLDALRYAYEDEFMMGSNSAINIKGLW